MKYSNTIEYNINTKLDNSGLIKLQSQIKQLENSMQQMSNRDIINESQVQEAKKQLEGLNTALTNSFNSSLGILDLSKFRAELDSSGVSAKGLQSAFNMMGAEGQVALNSLTTQIADFNGGIERTSSAVDKIFTTFSNTFRWGMISSFFSQFMNAIHSSIDYVKELDDSLTQIMLVTDYNRDSMNQFAKSANEAAKAVSMTTTGMTNASLIFAQQGYDLGQSQELATLSAKLANASQQDTATTSDQITAYMNAYGLENSIAELTQQMDNWALIANVSAADVGELAQASQRAASMANAVGVSGEQLAAQIATIESVTREAPEQIGNGLKTLYARFSDIAAGGEDEDGFDLGKVTSELNAIGVQIFDQMGQIRDVGDIMEDLMVIWNDLDQTSKVAASQALAGKYQVNRFMALMDNTDMYQEYKGATGSAATGTLDIMNEEYADSIAGRITKIQASLEGLFSTIFNTDDIYPWIDAAQGAVDLLQQFFDALGGGKVVLLGISTLLARTFNQNIARSINDVIANRNLGKIREQNVATVGDTLDRVGIDRSQGVGKYIEDTANQAKLNALSEKQYNDYMNNVQDWANASAALTKSEEDLINHVNTLNMVFGQLGEENAAILSKEGLNTYGAASNRGVLTNKDIVEAINGMDFTEVAGQAGIVANKLRDLQNIFNSGSLEANALAEATQHATEELMQFGKVQGFSSVRGEQLISDLNALSVKIKDDGEVTEESKKKLQSYITEMENLKRIASTMTSDKAKAVIADAGDTAQKVKSDVDFNRIREGRAEKNALEGQKNIDSQQNIKQILDAVNAVQELSFAWQSFQNLGSIWSNEDLSMGEKTIQTIMNVTASLYSLIPAIDKVTSSLHFSGKMSDTQKEIENSKKAVEDAQKILSLSSQNIDSIKEKVAAAQQAEDKATQAWLNKQEEALQQSKEIAEAARELQQAQDARTDSQKRKNKSTPDMHAAQEKLNKAQERQAEIKKEVLDLEEKTDKAFHNTLDAQGDLNDAIEQQRHAKADVEKATKNQEAAEKNLAAIEMKRVALNLAISAAMAGIAIAISAIQEEERKRVQAITDAAEESRINLDAIENSSFFEQWDAFKENGKLTDELKDSMAALAQQMGINIEAQDIYAGNIEQLNDKIRDNIELEKERARINFEAENEEFETQLNKNSIQAAQVGGAVTTASGTFNSAVDYIGQAGAAKTLAERLGEVANALSAVTAAREEFGKDSLEYNNALNNYQKLRDQLKDDEVDIDKANNNFKQLADLAIEEFKAGKDAQSLTGADWINFLNSDGGAEVRDYMESLGEEAGLQFKLGLLSQYDSENPLYSMIKGPGQIDLSNANLDMQNATEIDLLSNFIDMGGTFEDLGFKGYEDFSKALIEAANNQVITLSPQINLESKYDFDSDEEIDDYLKNNTNIDRNILDTSTDLRMQHARDNNYEEHDRYNGEKDYWENEVNKLSQERDEMYGEQRGNWDNEERIKKTEELTEAQEKLDEAIKDTEKDDKAYEKSLQKAAAAAARASKTLDDMNDHFDDNKKILEEGNETTIEYAEALTETKEDLAGLLDVDLETIPTSLAKNPAILEDMNTILHGTQEEADAAYQHLTELASSEIIDNMEFDIPVNLTQDGQTVTTESIRETLHGLIDALNAQSDLGIDVEADVNTTEWYNKVNELLASGALTADQLTQILSSAGYEGQFETKTEKGKVPITRYSVKVGELTTMGEPPNTISFPGSFTMTPETTYEEQDVTVPVLTGANQKNPLSGGTSKGGSGGSGKGGGGGKSCFVAGTLISTSLGFKPIEQIQKEDIVLSYNKSIGLNEYSEVLQTMIHDTTEPIYTLYIKDEQLRVTGIHRFLVVDKITCGIPQWIHAADLKVGQWVLFADGTWHVIHKIEVNIEHQIVYNFEVSHNHNYYVGRNQILAHNKGGKGGSGGSGKAKEPKTAEKKEAEKYQKKYYEEVDHQLDKVDKTLDKVEKTTDKLIGTQARTKQNEQIKLLQKELTLQQKKLKILQEQEKVDVAKNIQETDKKLEELLKKQGLNINILDITFDEEGFVKNYDEVGQAITDAQNKLIDKRNALINPDGTISDENEKRLKEIDKEISEYEKLGQELIKNIDRYDDIVNEELEIQNELEEIQDKIQDIAIDIYKASQEAIDDLKDLRKEWAKFEAMIYDSSKGESFLSLDNPIRQLKEIENELSNIYTISGKEARDYYNDIIAQQEKLKKNATTEDEIKAYDQAIEYYSKIRDSIDDGETLNNGLMQLALNDVVELKKIWDEWDETSRNNPIFGDNKAALKEQLEDAQKRLMEFVEDYEELIEDFKDKSLDIADHTADQWDKQLDRFDRVIDQLDRYSDTYSLIYGDEAYEMQENVLHQQAQTLQQQLDTAKLAYDAANSYYLEAYEKFVDKETGLAKEGYEAYMYELEEARNDAEDKMRDIAAEAAEKFSEAFEAAVMASTQYILRNTIGENDFEHSDRNWEWDKEYIDKYRDGVEKAYEMDKLRNRYIDMLNNAQGASLQTQNKIRAQMQEQLDLLDGQKTVSEYDVKLANAKLEILQKQIALEDAQRNKNKMQLRRDTQGNYRYVYTADKDNVDQAQQELLDSEYDAYEMSKQQQMNNYDDMINAYKRYLSQREEILTNNNLSEAQKIEQIKELWDRFQKYVNAAQEDFKDATAGTVDILQWLVVNGTDYTATAASDMLQRLVDHEGNVVEQSGIMWMDLANNMADNVIPKIEDAIIEADDHIISKMQETHDALVGNDGSSGLLAEVSGGANNFGDQCEIAAQQTAMLTEQSLQLQQALQADSAEFSKATENLQKYQMQLEQVSEASSNIAGALRDTQAALDVAKAESLNYRSQIDRLLSGEDIIVDHKIVNAEEYRRQQEEAKKKQQQQSSGGGRNALADARAIWYHGAWGNGGDWYTPYSRQFGTAAANKVLWYFNHGYGYNFDFDTGGYTGEWNQGEGVSSHKNGKLAFLHQKELILNAQDTENILSAVSMVRSLANSAQASMNNINTTASSNINSIYNPVTEQRVDIQASFPNATDAEDIRQALIGLSDRAYQYAHRVI